MMALALGVLLLGASPAWAQSHKGMGFGVKFGPMVSSLDTSGAATFRDKAGYQIGVFLGGNRQGVVGIATELTFIKRNAQAQGTTTGSGSVTALEIPLLIRVNVGSSHRTSGASVYLVVGPAIDINLKKFNTAFVSNTTGYDLNAIAGVGVEISRAILEFRYNKGFRSVARTLDAISAPVHTHSFAFLLGFRIN
jgi:hypothetical protein